MKKLLFTILITYISIFSAFTEEDEKIETLPHYIGGAAGFSTGYGLSYRYWPRDYGTQIVFAPYSSSISTTINLGTAGFKTLYETENTRLFLYLAANGTYENSISYDETSVSSRRETWGGTIGIGPGLEVYLFKNIVLDAMFGYKYSIGEADISTPGLGFTGEVAIYYRF